MRPKSIAMFERVFLASLVIALINSVLSWDDMTAALAREPAAAGFGNGLLVASIALSLLVPLVLWYFIARRASRIAKWILVILTVANFAVFVDQIGTNPGGVTMMLGTAVLVLQIYAVWHLFKADAVAWLAGESDLSTTLEGDGSGDAV